MVGKRYGKLPSDLMKMPLVELCFSADVASLAIKYENEQVEAIAKSRYNENTTEGLGDIVATLPPVARAHLEGLAKG